MQAEADTVPAGSQNPAMGFYNLAMFLRMR
jgi:hypothetical protein